MGKASVQAQVRAVDIPAAGTASLCELRIRTEVHWDGGDHYFGSEIVGSHSHARSCWDMNDLWRGDDGRVTSHDAMTWSLELAFGSVQSSRHKNGKKDDVDDRGQDETRKSKRERHNSGDIDVVRT